MVLWQGLIIVDTFGQSLNNHCILCSLAPLVCPYYCLPKPVQSGHASWFHAFLDHHLIAYKNAVPWILELRGDLMQLVFMLSQFTVNSYMYLCARAIDYTYITVYTVTSARHKWAMPSARKQVIAIYGFVLWQMALHLAWAVSTYLSISLKWSLICQIR